MKIIFGPEYFEGHGLGENQDIRKYENERNGF
jgi:hypothetical protein